MSDKPSWGSVAIELGETVTAQRREIRRLRRALREIRIDTRDAIEGRAALTGIMYRVNGIATRELKGAK